MGFTYVDGRKAVSISTIDNFLEYLVNQNTGVKNKDQLVQTVAFAYRAVQLRSQAIKALPFEITRIKEQGDETGKPVDTSADYKGVLEWLPSPTRMLDLMEQSLCVAGRAYWFRPRNRVIPLELQYWNPYTIKEKIDGKTGLYYFERTINEETPKRFEVDEVFYVWPPDYRVELGPPRGSPIEAAFKAAGVLDGIDEFVKMFFENGAIKPLLIAAKGMTNQKERERVRDWFKKGLTSLKQAFGVEVVNADTLTALSIGEGIENLDNNALTMERRESVVAALGVPMSMILSSTIAGMGGGGVATQDELNFNKNTIRPEGNIIAEIMNKQLFEPEGYRFKFLFDTMDVFQVDEQKRAMSFQIYTTGTSPMRPEVAATMLGLEIPKDDAIKDWYADAFIEPEPVPEALAQDEGGKDDVPPAVEKELTKERKKEKDDQLKASDLDKWLGFAVKRFNEGHPEKALLFESDEIVPTLHAGIQGALEGCEDVNEVKAVFANAALWQGYP